MKLAKVLFFLALLFCILQGCARVESVENMRSSLQAKVGTVYDIQHDRYYSTIQLDSTYEEKRLTRHDGCIYALVVNKKTKIIESWHFISDSGICRSIKRTGV